MKLKNDYIIRNHTKIYKKSKIDTIRFNKFDPILGVHQQYKTLKDDIHLFTYPLGYQVKRYQDVECFDRVYFNFKDIKIDRGETVIEDNSARVFGTPEAAAGKIRDDLQYNGIDFTQPLGVILVTDKKTLANPELIDSYTRILGQEKLGFTGWVFDVIFISEELTKSTRDELKEELAQVLNRFPPRTEQDTKSVTKTAADAFNGKNPTSAQMQEKVMRMTSASKEGEVTAALEESIGARDSYTFWTRPNKRKGFQNKLKENHEIEPFTEEGNYDESRNMSGHCLYEPNIKRMIVGVIEAWNRNKSQPGYGGEYFLSHYMRPTDKENFEDKEENLHKTLQTTIYNILSWAKHVFETEKIPLFHIGKYPHRNEHDILTKPVEVKNGTFSFPSDLKLMKKEN